MIETAWLRTVERRSRGPLPAAARAALAAGVPVWRLGSALDRCRKLGRRRSLGRATVSVGNLSVGGTGKTPAVAWVVERLREAGHRPAVLTRGHGGRPDAPADEVLLLRETLRPAVPVRADPDRHAGAAAVLAAAPDTTAFVLDDGFQRLDVARDLDLVLVDASRPLATARLLPAGFLREPPAGLKRADAVVLTRVERAGPAATDAAAAWVERRHGRPPLARFAHRWSELDLHPAFGGEPEAAPVGHLRGRRVQAAAGIGNPAAFAAQLEAAGALVVGSSPLRDHHRPDAAELARLHARARAEGAEAIVTTQKDLVKWRATDAGTDPLPVWVPRLMLEPVEGGAALAELLRERMLV